MNHVAPLPVWILGAVILAYNGAVFSLALYIQKRHPDLWGSFGGDWLETPNGSMQFSYRFARTGFYAVFQSKYRELGDVIVDRYVFAIRALLVLILVLIVVGKAGGLI